MVKIALTYEGELRVKAVHLPSGQSLVTDAPVDNHGRGQSFSPTDLLATSLGTCMATLMGIVAERHRFDLRGMKIEVEKIMSQQAPRKVAALKLVFEMPSIGLDQAQQRMLERAAQGCPVAYSLHPDVEVSTLFRWKSS